MSGRRYAENTVVTVERSRQELERLFRRYDAERFVQADEPAQSIVQVELRGRWYQFTVTMPVDWSMSVAAADREHRRRWRVLVLLMKAKLEATADEDGDEAMQRELLPYLLLPNGATFADAAAPQVEQMYASGIAPSPLQRFLPIPEEE